MKPPLTVLLLFIALPSVFAQSIIASKDFGNTRSLLVHELSFAKALDDGFIILKEEKRGVFNLERQDLNLGVLWETRIIFDPQLNVPQLMVYMDKALIVSYTVKELERSVTLELKSVDLTSGKIIHEAIQTFPQYQIRSPYPRISFSNDLSKILLSNYIPETSGMPEINILSTDDLSILKTVQLDKTIFDVPKFNRFAIDNQGNVFFVLVDEPLFRIDGYFIPAVGTEIRILPNDILFLRPTDKIPDVMIHVVEDSSCFIVAAAGNLQNELIGVKLLGFDFERNTITIDTVYDFTMANIMDLYRDAIPASRFVKTSSLKTPRNMYGFHLQELRLDSHRNIVLFFEKNLQKSTFQKGFNNGNLMYTYNPTAKRKLQKSEDVVVLAFDKEGRKNWGRVLQKYQVTKPFNFYMSYVSDLSDDVISLLTWTKRNSHSFQVTQIESATGKIIASGIDIIKDGKYTYHKNYTAWISGKHLAITTQKNNKMKSREIHMVKVIQ